MDFDVVLLAFHSYKNRVTAILSLCRCRAACVFRTALWSGERTQKARHRAAAGGMNRRRAHGSCIFVKIYQNEVLICFNYVPIYPYMSLARKHSTITSQIINGV